MRCSKAKGCKEDSKEDKEIRVKSKEDRRYSKEDSNEDRRYTRNRAEGAPRRTRPLAILKLSAGRGQRREGFRSPLTICPPCGIREGRGYAYGCRWLGCYSRDSGAEYGR